MHFWGVSLVIWFHLVHCFAVPLLSTSSATALIATPLVIPPSQFWDGNDGPWSSFHLRVGSPPQTVRILVSTSSNQPLVVLPTTCEFGGPNCPNDHGGVFNSTASTTWTSNNATYAVALDTNIGLVPDVRYGYDSVALGCAGSGTSTLPSQLVGEIITADLYTGVLGLNPLATNFSNGKAEVASYMSNLKAQNQIPSLSYGYNAGNGYRYSTALASLTLGGYDTSLFIPNNLTFAFNTQSSSDLTVFIKSITQESVSGNGTLLSSTIPAFIDSTTPYLWLPVDVCTQFELQFGIKYDKASGLYLVNNTLHGALLTQNAHITFTLRNTTSSETVDIVLPYAAFDLLASAPLTSNPTRYFPLKRANTTSQITLGRTFLQEAYLIADYERSKFSVSQMSWHSNTVSNIVPILPLSISPTSTANITAPTPETKRSVPTTTIIAATVSGSAFFLILIASIILIRHRRKKLDMMVKMKIKSPPTPPSPPMTFAPIIHEENCAHCRTQTPPSPEPIQGRYNPGPEGSMNSAQTSSLGNNDNERDTTPTPGGLATAPLPISPLSPSLEGASSQDSQAENQNTQISPLSPGPAILPRFSSLDRAAVPSKFETQTTKIPSVQSGIYELPAREEVGVEFTVSTPIETLLQAALDQVIASHQKEYDDHLKSPSRGGYLPVSPSTPPPEEEGRRRAHSPGYNGESSRVALPSVPKSRPVPRDGASSESPPRIRIPVYQPQPPHPDPENVSHPRVVQINAPLSRFNPQNQETSSSPSSKRVSANLNNQSQSFTFNIHPPKLKIFPSPPRGNSQPRIGNSSTTPTSRFQSPPPDTRPSTSHQTLGLSSTPRLTSRLPASTAQQTLSTPAQTFIHHRAQAEIERIDHFQQRATKPQPQPVPPTNTPAYPYRRPSSNSPPHRRTSSNSPPNRKRHSRIYPPPTSLPPDCPLPSLPALSCSSHHQTLIQNQYTPHNQSPTHYLDQILSQNEYSSRNQSFSQNQDMPGDQTLHRSPSNTVVSQNQTLARSQESSRYLPSPQNQSSSADHMLSRSASSYQFHRRHPSRQNTRPHPHILPRSGDRRRTTIIEEEEPEEDEFVDEAQISITHTRTRERTRERRRTTIIEEDEPEEDEDYEDPERRGVRREARHTNERDKQRAREYSWLRLEG